ncbi:MAG: glycosyltransferase family 4 protein [Bacteroidales bacterium]
MNKKIKVLLIGPCPFDLESIKGGVEGVFINLLEGFKQIEDVQIIGFTLSQEVKRETTKIINKNIQIHFFPLILNSTKLSIFYYSIFRLRKFIADNKINIVHLQGNGSSLLYTLRLEKKKLIVTPHGLIKNEYKNSMSFYKKLNYLISLVIENFLFRKIKNIIFISDYIKNYFLNCSNLKYKKLHINTIYNPINSIFFDKDVSGDFSRITYVGNINNNKNLLLLIEANSFIYNKYEIDAIGAVNEKKYYNIIKDKVQYNKSKINFLGPKTSPEVKNILSKNIYFILPSRHENLPLVIAEAMASSRIVIASNVGGVSEMIEDEVTGFLFENNNLDQLVKILSNLENHDLVKISNSAYNSAFEKYHPISVANKTKSFYQSVLNNAK